MQFTQKETELLNELKNQEKLCTEKYLKHSSCAKDVQLKNLFSQLAQTEQGHLESLDQISSGTVPQTSSSSQSAQTFNAKYTNVNTPEKSEDCFLCSDALASEKYASNLYDTCVFEFKDQNLRNFLNHIQKEEQQHGKLIYDYMNVNGMYS